MESGSEGKERIEVREGERRRGTLAGGNGGRRKGNKGKIFMPSNG